MTKYLLSEGDVLERIRKFQVRSQALPLALVIVSFVLAMGFGNNIFLLIFAIAGALLFANAFMTHRYRQRILQPLADSLYAPVSGKVESLVEAGDILRITIHKRAYDPVEIRCPIDGCYWEATDLILKDPRLRLSFSAKRIFRITDARMKVGEVLSLMIGKGTCVIELPKSLSPLVQRGSVCEAGETRICVLDEIAQS